jgi:hypothetical protein
MVNNDTTSPAEVIELTIDQLDDVQGGAGPVAPVVPPVTTNGHDRRRDA